MQTYAAYQAIFTPANDGGFEVSFPQFPGCVTFGDTFESAQAAATEALSLWIEELQARHKFNPSQVQLHRPVIAEVTIPNV